MTPEAQRIAIAEKHLGVTDVQTGVRYGYGLDENNKTVVIYIPDYLNDLNASREAFLELSDGQESSFYRWLKTIVERDAPNLNIRLSDIVNATATQRAEAFLRTIGKWVD